VRYTLSNVKAVRPQQRRHRMRQLVSWLQSNTLKLQYGRHSVPAVPHHMIFHRLVYPFGQAATDLREMWGATITGLPHGAAAASFLTNVRYGNCGAGAMPRS